MKTFQQELYCQLQQMAEWAPHQAFTARAIEQAPCGNTVAPALEQFALAQLGIAPGSVVDWTTPPAGAKGAGSFNWAAFLAFIEMLLPIILPLLKQA